MLTPKLLSALTFLAIGGCGDTSETATTNTTTITSTVSSTVSSTTTTTSTDTQPVSTFDELFRFDGEAPKNLIMISVDTWRKDHFDRYKDDKSSETTPFFNSLLDHAVTLDMHQSCSSWTYPSIECALAGKDPYTVGFMPPHAPPLDDMPKDVDFLAKRLDDAGYQTHVVSANGMLCSYNIGEEYDNVDCLYSFALPDLAEDMRPLGLAAMESLQKGDAPWFLHLHYMDLHTPYSPPEEYLTELKDLVPLDFLTFDWDSAGGVELNETMTSTLTEKQKDIFMTHVRARYRAGVMYADDQINLMLADFQKLGALDDALLVFWADHGEQLYEFERIGHGASLHTQETDVMAMFYAPNLEPKNWGYRTAHEDITPTTLQLLGVKSKDDFTGSVIGNDDNSRTHFAFLLRDGLAITATRGSLRIHYDWTTGAKQFFDLEADPTESKDIYDSTDPDVISIWSDLSAELKRIVDIVKLGDPVDPGP